MALTSGQIKYRQQQKGKRIPPEDRQLIVARYHKGATMTDMAREYGVSITSISRTIKREMKKCQHKTTS
jgi:DNA-directed RNA polymerase specialized sigma24 family protein